MNQEIHNESEMDFRSASVATKAPHPQASFAAQALLDVPPQKGLLGWLGSALLNIITPLTTEIEPLVVGPPSYFPNNTLCRPCLSLLDIKLLWSGDYQNQVEALATISIQKQRWVLQELYTSCTKYQYQSINHIILYFNIHHVSPVKTTARGNCTRDLHTPRLLHALHLRFLE